MATNSAIHNQKEPTITQAIVVELRCDMEKLLNPGTWLPSKNEATGCPVESLVSKERSNFKELIGKQI